MKITKEVNTDELKVGDIVAEGIRSANDTCDFGDIKIRTSAPNDGKTRWVGIDVDRQCKAVVNAKWHGSLTECPKDVIEPLLKILPTETSIVPENPQSASLSTMASSKTSEQHVYMYGYGGSLDKLTHKYGTLTFTYDGQSATISSQSGSCSGSKLTGGLALSSLA